MQVNPAPIPIRVSKTESVSLFPTFLWRTRLQPVTRDALNARILGYLDRLAPDEAQAEGSKLQTEQHLHAEPGMEPLAELIEGTASAVLDFLKARHEGVVITGCWANIGAPGSPHKRHTHPNNFLSGVYYVLAPEGGNVITLHDPRPHTSIISPPPAEIGPSNAGKVDFRVEPGDLIIFPSWLAHSVPPNLAGTRRVSVAFNVMFKNYVETMSPPRWKGRMKLDTQ